MKPLSENGMFNEIVYDLTHIYRTTSIYLLNAINYFEILYYNIKLKNINYGLFSGDLNINPIKNFKDILDIMSAYKTIINFKI